MKLRPCDCKDQFTANKLSEQGVGFNECSMNIQPGVVVITRGYATLNIPMFIFKMFAEWYLEEQDVEGPEPIAKSTDTSVK